MRRFFLLIFFALLAQISSYAQCSITISSYPYNQGFESGSGSWVSGGTGNDWAMGTPSKAFITSAGGGTKCWVTGGLTGSFYTNGERSYVTSPCFDFSSLTNPYISFKIYWECENIYDGASFQSSIDNGVTWTNVGADTDPVNCMNQNWFNNANIINLSSLANPKSGWAGSSLPTSGSCQGGGGSNGWVTAKHCLAYLAGQASVRFRFVFGAGTSCNNYDGVAFDDIKIEEAPSNLASYTFACTGNPLEYQFTNTSILCPNSYSWNFGDPVSGTNNGTGVQNPTHVFSSPGTYVVTLTVSGPCNNSSTITQTISTLSATVTSTNISCAGLSNGSIITTASNTTGSTSYMLQPGGTSNSTGNFSGLSSGTYTVQITDALGCSITSSASISSPPSINWNSFSSTNISCNGLNDGKLVCNAIGGAGSFNYALSPLGTTNTTGIFNNLNSGAYTVIATDANGCTASSIFTILNPPLLTIGTNTKQDILCNGANNGFIHLTYNGGTGSLTYVLNPGGITNTTGQFNNLNGGNYTVTCTDINGCSSSTTHTINEPIAISINSIDIKQPGCNPNNDGTITINASGGTSPLSYSIGGSFGTNNFFSNMTSNTYTVTVRDGNGCTASTLAVLVSINAPTISNFVDNDVSCAGLTNGSIQITAISAVPIISYSLSPGSQTNTSGNFNSLSSGFYTVTITDANGCTNTTEAIIDTPTPLVIQNLTYLSDSCGGKSDGRLIIDAIGGSFPYSFLVTPGSGLQSSNVFSNLSAGTYTVRVIDAHSCSESRQLIVQEKICCEEIFVPNAFTPNNDGLNDEFGLKGTNGTEFMLFNIYNRWGELVFRGQNLFDSWNGNYKGEYAEVGTYYYVVKYLCTSSNKTYLRKGDLILIR